MTKPDHLFYDHHCSLCQGFLGFVRRRDPSQRRFVTAPLFGEVFDVVVPLARQSTLPDSAVVVTGDGAVMVEWAMARRVFQRLGGPWRVVAWFMKLVPRRLGNGVYRLIARHRKHFARGREPSCRI